MKVNWEFDCAEEGPLEEGGLEELLGVEEVIGFSSHW